MHKIKYLFLILSLIWINACSKDDASLEDKNLNIEMISLNLKDSNTSKQFSIASDDALLSFSKDKFNGFVGCNRFFGSLEYKKNTVIFKDDIASTKMLCDPITMEIEDSLLSFLKGEFTWEKNQDEYLLENDKISIYLKEKIIK